MALPARAGRCADGAPGAAARGSLPEGCLRLYASLGTRLRVRAVRCGARLAGLLRPRVGRIRGKLWYAVGRPSCRFRDTARIQMRKGRASYCELLRATEPG